MINVKDFGAIGDGVTDDTAAFTIMLEELRGIGGYGIVPAGTYSIAPSGISQPSRGFIGNDVHLVGEGFPILKVSGQPTNHLLAANGVRWSVEAIAFDMGDFLPTIGVGAIGCRGDDWRLSRCTILNSGKWGIIAYGGSKWTIEKSFIHRNNPTAQPAQGAILATANAGQWPTDARFIENECEGVGLSVAGVRPFIARNKVRGSGSGTGIFVQGAPSTTDATVIDNECSGGLSGFDDAQGGHWWAINGMEIWSPNAVIVNNSTHDNDGGGIAFGGPNSLVVGNKSYDNGHSGRPNYAGFAARIREDGQSANGSIMAKNASFDTRYQVGIMTQDYGLTIQAGVTDLKRAFNDFTRNRVGAIKQL